MGRQPGDILNAVALSDARLMDAHILIPSTVLGSARRALMLAPHSDAAIAAKGAGASGRPSTYCGKVEARASGINGPKAREQDKRTGTRAVASVCLHMSWRGTQVWWQRAAQVRAPRSTLELARAVYAGVRWPLPAPAQCARPTKIDFALVSRL